MCAYIINTYNVVVSREAPLQPGENAIIVASLDELRAARLSGKRLLALWNGLPGAESRREAADFHGDRERP